MDLHKGPPAGLRVNSCKHNTQSRSPCGALSQVRKSDTEEEMASVTVKGKGYGVFWGIRLGEGGAGLSWVTGWGGGVGGENVPGQGASCEKAQRRREAGFSLNEGGPWLRTSLSPRVLGSLEEPSTRPTRPRAPGEAARVSLAERRRESASARSAQRPAWWNGATCPVRWCCRLHHRCP